MPAAGPAPAGAPGVQGAAYRRWFQLSGRSCVLAAGGWGSSPSSRRAWQLARPRREPPATGRSEVGPWGRWAREWGRTHFPAVWESGNPSGHQESGGHESGGAVTLRQVARGGLPEEGTCRLGGEW